MPRRAETRLTVAASPEEVAARLKGQTRFRLMPAEARFIARHDRPLAGRVRVDGFRVALNRRDPLTRLQAVAVGRVTPQDGGSRIDIVAGLPPGLTWVLRLSFLLGIAATGTGVWAGLGQGDLAGAAVTILAMGVFLLAATLGLGLNVANADAQVPELLAQVEAALKTAPPPQPEAQPEPQEDASQRKAAAAAARQRQG